MEGINIEKIYQEQKENLKREKERTGERRSIT